MSYIVVKRFRDISNFSIVHEIGSEISVKGNRAEELVSLGLIERKTNGSTAQEVEEDTLTVLEAPSEKVERRGRPRK